MLLLTRRSAFGIVCFLVGLGLWACLGCDSKPKTIDITGVKRNWEHKPSVEIDHDFGLMRPNQKLSHLFMIKNDSNTPWKLAGIQQSCKCTASRPRSDSVAPGESMGIDVEYTAPTLTRDDVHQVGVEFTDDSVPYFWLKVRATVQEPICVSPSSLHLESSVVGPAHREDLTLANYMQHPIRQPVVVCSVPWLKADLQTIPPIVERFPARQTWQVHLMVDTASLVPGAYQAQIEFQTDDPEAPRKVVPVELTTGRLFEVAPSELAFGMVSPGATASRKVLIRAAPTASPLRAADVKIEHGVGPRLSVACESISDKVLALSAALQVPKDAKSEKLSGVVRLNISPEQSEPIEVPVSAVIK